MKYKLINTETKEETICDKVSIGCFDYYVSDEKPLPCTPANVCMAHVTMLCDNCGKYQGKSIIASNNPNIDIPKVVDEVEILANMYCNETDRLGEFHDFNSFKYAYNKSQETHPFSEEDMIDFKIWCDNNAGHNWLNLRYKSTQELIKLWKEQQHKKVYYS